MGVPDRFEDQIGEAQHQNVLYGVLAEVVVDPVDLILLEVAVQLQVERFGGVEVPPERLLQHHVAPRTPVLRFGQQPGVRKVFQNRRIELRRHRQIDRPVRGQFTAAFELVQTAAQRTVELRREVIPGMVVDPLQKVVHLTFTAAGKFGPDVFAERLVRIGRTRAPHNPRLLVHQTAPEQVEERRIQFPFRQIPRRAENHQRAGRRTHLNTEISTPVVALEHDANSSSPFAVPGASYEKHTRKRAFRCVCNCSRPPRYLTALAETRISLTPKNHGLVLFLVTML